MSTKLFRLLLYFLACTPSYAQVYEWGTWGTWSSCSVQCGKGIQTRKRRCLKTSVASETVEKNIQRRGCSGPLLDYRFCDSRDCDSNVKKPVVPKVTFHDAYRIRAEQCKVFDKQTYNRRKINWKPYMRDHLKPCELYCLAAGHKFYARLKNNVRDGTPCGKDYSKVCIQGNCQQRPDGCYSLDGPCRMEKRWRVIGVFNSTELDFGYNFVATIPAGSTDINVEELTQSRSYLALKDHNSGVYYLNGHWMISLSKTFQSGGTKIHYKRDGNTRRGGETIKVDGPLEKSLDIMMIYQGDKPTIMYSFFVTEKEYHKLKQKSQLEGPKLYFSNVGRNAGQNPEAGSSTPKRKQEEPRLPFNPNKIRNVYPTPQHPIESVTFPGQRLQSRYSSDKNGFRYPQRQSDLTRSYLPPRGQTKQDGVHRSPSWYGSSWVQFGGDRNDAKETPVANAPFHRRPLLNQQTFQSNQYGNFKIPGYQGGNLEHPYSQTSSQFGNSKIPQYQRGNWKYPLRQTPNQYGYSKIPDYQSRQWVNPLGQTPNTERRFYTGNQEVNGRTLLTYIWRTAGFTPCSATCAGGIQSGMIKCVRSDTEETVLDGKCDPNNRPEESRRVCNLQPCPASWAPQEWKDCSKTCGEGIQMRDLMCKQVIDRSGEKVTVMLPIMECPVHLRPEVVRKCFLKPCPLTPKPKWVTENWNKCSVECGHGIQRRSVICKNYQNETVQESKCESTKKPPGLKACYLGLCKAAWYTGTEWSQCSKSCGAGIRSRPVICARIDGSALNEVYCKDKEKPKDTENCNEQRCRGVWMTSEWSECSKHCGNGVQDRVVICMRYINGKFQETFDAHCPTDDKPAVRKECKGKNCNPSWFSTPWTECSVTCGHGVQTRHVSCLDGKGANVGGCKTWERPLLRRGCHPKPCPEKETKPTTPTPSCTDNPPRLAGRYCNIVKRVNFCRIRSYAERCCATCSSGR